MLDLTFSWEFETIKYPEDITYDATVGRKSRSAVNTSTFVSKVEKSVARESETLPTPVQV